MRRPPALACCALLAAWLMGCAAVEPRTPLTQHVGRSDLSVSALRMRVRDLARRFSGLLEASADEIADAAGTPRARRAMTTFKINAVPAMQAALLQPDPVASLVDAWALLAQLQQVLPQYAPDVSPALMEKATGLLRSQEEEVEALWRELSGNEDVSRAHGLVHDWAMKHPLTGPLVARQSTVPLLAEVSSLSGLRPMGAAAVLVEDVRDITARVDLYAGSLPRQARWQAESLAQEALASLPLMDVVNDLDRAVDTLDRFGTLAGATPALVARERTAVLEALDGQRRSVERFVEDQRLALMGDVRGEREAVVAALHSERVEALQQVDRMGYALIDHAFDRGTALVDRVFLWLLGLVALGVVGAVAVVALLARRGTSARH